MNADRKYLINFFLRLVAVMWVTGCTIIIMHTWFTAYFHGDRVMVYINLIGERDIELVMWMVMTPITIFGISDVLQDIWNESRSGYLRKRIKRALGLKPDKVVWL